MVKKWLANKNEELNKEEIAEICEDVEYAMNNLLETLRIDTENDHNTKDTAKRVAKMFVHEVFKGRYYPMPKVTSFPNVKKYDQLYLSGPITIRSTCAHHFQNIVGKCWIGIYPGETVIGLSKFNRIVDWIASRPQIQEEMTVQIADLIERETKALGVAVIVKAEHFCMTHRGVREHDSDMTTSVMRGVFLQNKDIKNEFLTLLSGMKGFK